MQYLVLNVVLLFSKLIPPPRPTVVGAARGVVRCKATNNVTGVNSHAVPVFVLKKEKERQLLI